MNINFTNQVDAEIIRIEKSIANNLKSADYFVTESQDTATYGVELKPPVSMAD